MNSSILDMAGSLPLPVIRFLLLLVFKELSFLWSMFLICKINCNYEIAADARTLFAPGGRLGVLM